MLVHILCPECSGDLGAVFKAYLVLKDKYYEDLLKKNKNIHISTLEYKDDIEQNIEFIFKGLKIDNQCCRIHMMGHL
jgi:DNA-directed RNA polymerase subunit N (RpoN/RPB10)